MEKKKTTIRDISLLAGVSKATVSHVLNGTKAVGPETRSRVLKAIEQTGYQRNYLAKALKSAESRMIGLIVTNIRNQYYIELIDSIENEAYRNGYTVLLTNSDDDPQRELTLLKSLAERQVDGIILSPLVQHNHPLEAYLQKIGRPFVLIDRFMRIPCDWVGPENQKAAASLVRHLLALGHRKIIMVSGTRGISTTEERIQGYKNALAEYGIAVDESLIICGESRSIPAAANVKAYLELAGRTPPAPTAIVTANNQMLLGTMRALQELQIKVPQDMALVSFDDFEWSNLFQPRLTTISQPCYEMGQVAVELLLRRIRDPHTAYVQKRCESSLLLRESCGRLLDS